MCNVTQILLSEHEYLHSYFILYSARMLMIRQKIPNAPANRPLRPAFALEVLLVGALVAACSDEAVDVVVEAGPVIDIVMLLFAVLEEVTSIVELPLSKLILGLPEFILPLSLPELVDNGLNVIGLNKLALEDPFSPAVITASYNGNAYPLPAGNVVVTGLGKS